MRTIAAGVLLSLIGTSVAANELAGPVLIIQDDIPHAAPFLADVDGDGKKDLLVGQYRDDPFTGARVRLFRNLGTAKAPNFDEGVFLQAGTVDVACDEFCHTGFGPQLIDFNGDGNLDLITGSRDCQVFVFSGRGDGGFATASRLKYVTAREHHRVFQYNARLFAHDWDADGNLDLITARNRSIWLFRNTGDTNVSEYAAPVELVSRGAEKIWIRVPVVADWDNDNRDDLIVGRSDGSVVWHRNTTEAGAEPRLETAVVLVEAGHPGQATMDADGHYERPPAPTQNIRLCVADYNDDGRGDLLLGDSWFLHRQKSRRSAEEAQQRVIAYTAYNELRDQLEALEEAAESESEAARAARAAEIAAKTIECAKAWRAAYSDGQRTSRHGSVWLFERVATPQQAIQFRPR